MFEPLKKLWRDVLGLADAVLLLSRTVRELNGGIREWAGLPAQTDTIAQLAAGPAENGHGEELAAPVGARRKR